MNKLKMPLILVGLSLICFNPSYAKYDHERDFIDLMPKVDGETNHALRDIKRLSAGMMARQTNAEVSFSNRLWSDAASLCTNGAIHGVRATSATYEEFQPIARNIIMQAAKNDTGEWAKLMSFTFVEHGNDLLATHQTHHFIFLRAAQIAYKTRIDGDKKGWIDSIVKQTVQAIDQARQGTTQSASPYFYWCNLMPLTNEDIRASLTRFKSLFFDLFLEDNAEFKQKIEVDRQNYSWANEDIVAFIYEQSQKKITAVTKNINIQQFPKLSEYIKSVQNLLETYTQLKNVLKHPNKIVQQLEAAPLMVIPPCMGLMFPGKEKEEAKKLQPVLERIKNDLEDITYFSRPLLHNVPQLIDVPLESIAPHQLPEGLEVKKGTIKTKKMSGPTYLITQESEEAVLVFHRFWVGKKAKVQIVRKLENAATYIYQTSAEPQFILGDFSVEGGKKAEICAPTRQYLCGGGFVNEGSFGSPSAMFKGREPYVADPCTYNYPLRKREF